MQNCNSMQLPLYVATVLISSHHLLYHSQQVSLCHHQSDLNTVPPGNAQQQHQCQEQNLSTEYIILHFNNVMQL